MSRVTANIWGKILIRNKLITQEKWEFVASEYLASGASTDIGQMLVDAGYINVKQMQQINGVVAKVLAKAQPDAVPQPPQAAPEPEPVPIEDDDEGGIEMEPERDDSEKLEIKNLDEIQKDIGIENPASMEAAPKVEALDDDDEDGMYELAGEAPTEDDGYRVSDVNWHAEGKVEEYKRDESAGIELEGDDDD